MTPSVVVKRSFAALLLSVTGLPILLAKSATEKAAQAATHFLETLSEGQRQKVVYSYSDAKQRARWSNFPTGFVPRGGISLQEMTLAQQAAVMELLATVLSPMGLEKVNQIRLADDDFKANGSRTRRGGPPGRNGGPPGPPPPGANLPPPPSGGLSGRRGGPPTLSSNLFGKDLYYISFLGQPSATAPWMLQFGGHHLALNITIAGSRGVMTPSLTGAQPATFRLNGKTIRPLGRESDQALALLQSLNTGQRQQAVLNYSVPDLVLGPGEDGKTIVPEGLKVSAMNASQQKALLDLVAEWAGMMNESAASVRMKQLDADLRETWFAWSGPTEFSKGSNITAYYRVQGPHLVIEYAPQHDDPTNHVHTIYRDPTNDYGREFGSR